MDVIGESLMNTFLDAVTRVDRATGVLISFTLSAALSFNLEFLEYKLGCLELSFVRCPFEVNSKKWDKDPSFITFV